MTIENYIHTIIEREGGYVDHPDDKGGATKYGITIHTLGRWRGKEVTANDVRNLDKQEAVSIYTQYYIVEPGLNNIEDDRLKMLMLDMAVHSGPVQAIRALQSLVRVKVDGVMGCITAQVVNHHPSIETLRKQYLATRIRFLVNLVKKNPSQVAFAAGWANRMADLLETVV